MGHHAFKACFSPYEATSSLFVAEAQQRLRPAPAPAPEGRRFTRGRRSRTPRSAPPAPPLGRQPGRERLSHGRRAARVALRLPRWLRARPVAQSQRGRLRTLRLGRVGANQEAALGPGLNAHWSRRSAVAASAQERLRGRAWERDGGDGAGAWEKAEGRRDREEPEEDLGDATLLLGLPRWDPLPCPAPPGRPDPREDEEGAPGLQLLRQRVPGRTHRGAEASALRIFLNLSSAPGSMSPTTTSQILARKRRRGIIEKRRRDRINNSLSELRRLVPSAFEKQGSAKLEKAEILQMTVDHLKMLHTAGGKGNVSDLVWH
ncbi:hypothetical protein JD844_016054 [Phrynosoma platyrhinos]|uniref:BHLH domain-containing protein n=1 Tax=Phrynosoma platyrhinos TaxID=52577 RepID=A0ABQ7SJU4_PHRPL|nr:hypothetical protein JD844_016054 [Phrynosoma platyrhinos]